MRKEVYLASGRQLLGLECESNPGCVANELRDLWGWGTLGVKDRAGAW